MHHVNQRFESLVLPYLVLSALILQALFHKDDTLFLYKSTKFSIYISLIASLKFKGKANYLIKKTLTLHVVSKLSINLIIRAFDASLGSFFFKK